MRAIWAAGVTASAPFAVELVIALWVSDGLFRLEDGGATRTSIRLPSPAFAIDLSEDGRTIGVVTQTTDV